MTRETQIVIGPDGTVLAATGELASSLIDVRLRECAAVPREVHDAEAGLLRRLRQSPGRIATQEIALDGGERLVRLIAIEALPLRRTAVDLRSLLASKLAVLASQAAATEVAFSVLVADDVPAVVRVDAEKLAWSVTTLVGNALRYVQAGSRRPAGRIVAVRATREPMAGDISIEVQDDGPGIPPDTIARLFRRDGLNVQGAGLALLLMSDICAAHGASVDVRSSTAGPDHGTTVRIRFAAD